MKKTLVLFAFLFASLTINAQWVEQTSGLTTSLRSVSAVNGNVAWISGNSGVVLRTTDGGAVWSSVGGGVLGTNGVHNIFAVDANTALICVNPASGGFLYKTTDGGATWNEVLTQTGGFFNAVYMSSSTNGFLTGDPVGGRWSNFRTTDGGTTWDSTGMFLAQNGAEAGWNNSFFASGSRFYFGTNSSRIYYSSDMGASWTAQSMALTNSFALWFNTLNNGIVGGSTQGLVATTNGGTSWNAMASLGTGTISSITGFQNRWFHTRGIRLFETTDNGATWDTAYVAAAGTYNAFAAAREGDVAWGVRSNGGITKGTNIGLPVELTSFTAAVIGNGVKLSWATAAEINNKGFEVKRKAHSAESSAWETIAFIPGAGTTTEKQNYSYQDNSVSSGKYIYRLRQIDFDGSSTYSHEVEADLNAPLTFQLAQNYPNPFNPSTLLRYSIPEAGVVRLTVFNILGEEVALLINNFKEAGTHEVTFDAVNLSGGVYLYKLQAGESVLTKKMLLLK